MVLTLKWSSLPVSVTALSAASSRKTWYSQSERHSTERSSGEASITANPGGRFLFLIWNEEELDGEEVIGSDAIFRRVLLLDDYVPAEYQIP
jgi:hypothetical protein